MLRLVVEKKAAEVELRFYRFPGALLASEAQRCQVAGDVGSLLHRPVRSRKRKCLAPPEFQRQQSLPRAQRYGPAVLWEAKKNFNFCFFAQIHLHNSAEGCMIRCLPFSFPETSLTLISISLSVGGQHFGIS